MCGIYSKCELHSSIYNDFILKGPSSHPYVRVYLILLLFTSFNFNNFLSLEASDRSCVQFVAKDLHKTPI